MNLVSNIIRLAKTRYVEYKYKKSYDYCAAVFRERLVKNSIPADEPAPGEDVYVKFWQQFHKRVEPYTYRYFHTLCNNDPRIVPEDIANRYIESVLNPKRYRGFYADKNMYGRYIQPKEAIPATLLYRVMGGLLYTESEKNKVSFDISAEDLAALIDGRVKRVVLKPTIDSNSGHGVMLFMREGKLFVSKDGDELSGAFLRRYGNDFAVQKVIEQHEYLKQFSETSINTMRIMTYRSVKDDSVMVFAACLRIGHNGSFVDNLFSGGCFLPIDVKTGKLGKELYNRYWQTSTEMNGIDFAHNEFVLPFWDEAKVFATSIAQQVPHARLLAQDIIIDATGNPRLIEFNVDDFDWSMAMASSKSIPFGDKFDEVIDYSLKHKNV